MRVVSLIFGILAALGLLLGLIFGAMSRDRGAITLSAVVAVLGALRLMLGGGVF